MDDKGFEQRLRNMSPSEAHTYDKLVAERNKVMDLKRKNNELLAALKAFVDSAAHTRVFLTSREKMNSTGVGIFDEDVRRADAAIKATP